ncbi:MAG: quinolinate synthase NadA [Desulfobacteraceae bacterium]|jgi:quinolinate synthase
MKQQIRDLLKAKKAILLAHNYQPAEVQDVADLTGDSLELSIKASKTDAEVIVFCGVHFMAETACILCPDKTVLLPRTDAGCPMADMITADSLKKRLVELPPMPVVTYVNSSAAVKALSTICCTSANVVKVANSVDHHEMLMTPDRNLAMYAAARTDKKIHIWDGCCPYHDALKPEDVIAARQAHPDAVFMAHPECRQDVLEMADVINSTSGMIKFASESPAKSFIVGTETGLLHGLKKANPGKSFYPASLKLECAEMKKITLDDIVKSLEYMNGRVTVPEDIRLAALSSVQRMIELA